MSEQGGAKQPGAVEKVAAFIVDKRKAFYLVYIGLAIFCFFSRNWVQVNNDITSYLPDTTETRQGLTLMNDQFVTYGTNRIMVDNLSFSQAEALAQKIEQVAGVTSCDTANDEDSFKAGAALLSITYDVPSDDVASNASLAAVREILAPYDAYVTGDVGASTSETIAAEMQVVMVIVVIIILVVLTFTSHTYAEIPVLLMTFGMAALLNIGTNFLFGEISFISNSVAVVLQLALAIDYAIILCHRYTEERLALDAREAVIAALSKAIPEISGSSLTTLSGLAAMMFMHFKIGYDMGIVLMKAIVLSLLCVFTLMPGLLMSMSSLIDRSHHKSFVPNITPWGHFAVKTRYIMPPIFLVLLIAGFFFSNKTPYAYGYSNLTTATKNQSQLDAEKVNATFGSTNTLALLVPVGDYDKERALIRELEAMPEIDTVLGLGNIEAMDGYVLTDKLTPRQFAELTDLDIEPARLLYTAYAVNHESYGRVVSGIDNYRIPLIDLFLFVYDQMQEGYLTLDADMTEQINDLYDQLTDGQRQLKGETHSRIVLNLALPEESEQTFAFLDTLHQTAAKYYPEDVFLVGNSTSDFDLASSFVGDNLLISILTIVFVILVLLFTFKSAGLPVLLILVIQGSIWINFSFPYLTKTPLFFLSYLIVSSIQMGANIDYAIVITNRYTQLKTEMPLKDAIVETLNQAFPTILTSGSILAAAGVFIGQLSSDPAIASIGVCLGRGTLLSIALVMGNLPQILLLGDVIIEKTAFTMRRRGILQKQVGSMRVSGHVRGYVSGMIDADVSGTLIGSINAMLEAGSVPPEQLEGAGNAAEEEKADE